MEPQLLLSLFAKLVAREGLNQVLEHADAELAHLLTLFGKMKPEVVEILRLDVFVDGDLFYQLFIAVVDEGAQHPQAEIGPARGRIEVPAALANERDREVIPTLGGDHVVVPQQLHIVGDAGPLLAARAVLQLDNLVVDLCAQRLGIYTLHEFQEGAEAGIVSLEEKKKALLQIAEELLTREVLTGAQSLRIVSGLPLEEPVEAAPVASGQPQPTSSETERPPVVPSLGKPLPQE